MRCGCLLVKQPYHASPARQHKGNHRSSCSCVQQMRAVAPRSRETAGQHLLPSASSVMSAGPAGRDGRGVWCGKVMAQYQIWQNPPRPQAPSSPAPRTSSGKLSRSPKTSRNSYEQPKKINMTGRASVLPGRTCTCSGGAAPVRNRVFSRS